MKTCTKCNILHPIENYHRDCTAPDGHVAQCKSCRKKSTFEYNSRPEVKKRISEYGKSRRTNPDFVAQQKKRDREYYENPENRERIKGRSRLWQQDPNNKIKSNARRAKRKAEDVQFRLASNLRGRLGVALKQGSKVGSAVDDLGCSINELREHLESKFQPGMTWENWGRGRGKWQIDHIMPLAAFNLTDRQHVLLACYYLNLQPLWWEDNLAKHDKILL